MYQDLLGSFCNIRETIKIKAYSLNDCKLEKVKNRSCFALPFEINGYSLSFLMVGNEYLF